MASTIGHATYETQQLTDRLKKLVASETYDVLPYAELSKIVGRDVQKDMAARAHLASARRICERDTGRLVDVVSGEGVKLLTPSEQAALGPDGLKRLKRFTNRRLTRLSRVQYDKLDNAEKLQHNLSASVLGAVQMFTRPKSLTRIEGAIQKASDKLPIGETLKLFDTKAG